MYIDTDSHYWPIKFLERVNHPRRGHLEFEGDLATYYRDGELVHSFREGRWNLDLRIQVMDEEGFDAQVLIPDNRQLIYQLAPELGRAMAVAYNDTVAEEVGGNPRFIGVAWVYLPDISASIKELRRAVEDLGLKAVKLMGGFDHVELDSETLYPFYEEVARLDVPILVHPAGRTAVGRDDSVEPWIVGADHFEPFSGLIGLLGMPFSYMNAYSRLILNGTLDRFPTLRFAVFEGGVGWVPFLMSHLNHHQAHQWKSGGKGDTVIKFFEGRERLRKEPSAYFDQFFPAAICWEAYLPQITQLWPNHNIMIGSDYNHGDFFSTWPNTVRTLKATPGLSEEDKEKILGGNAMRLFKMTAGAEAKPVRSLA